MWWLPGLWSGSWAELDTLLADRCPDDCGCCGGWLGPVEVASWTDDTQSSGEAWTYCRPCTLRQTRAGAWGPNETLAVLAPGGGTIAEQAAAVKAAHAWRVPVQASEPEASRDVAVRASTVDVPDAVATSPAPPVCEWCRTRPAVTCPPLGLLETLDEYAVVLCGQCAKDAHIVASDVDHTDIPDEAQAGADRDQGDEDHPTEPDRFVVFAGPGDPGRPGMTAWAESWTADGHAVLPTAYTAVADAVQGLRAANPGAAVEQAVLDRDSPVLAMAYNGGHFALDGDPDCAECARLARPVIVGRDAGLADGEDQDGEPCEACRARPAYRIPLKAECVGRRADILLCGSCLQAVERSRGGDR